MSDDKPNWMAGGTFRQGSPVGGKVVQKPEPEDEKAPPMKVNLIDAAKVKHRGDRDR